MDKSYVMLTFFTFMFVEKKDQAYKYIQAELLCNWPLVIDAGVLY